MDLVEFRIKVKDFLSTVASEVRIAGREHDHYVSGFPEEHWREAAAKGLLGIDVDACYGGLGIKDIRYSLVLAEEIINFGVNGFELSLHNDVVIPYIDRFGSEEQKVRWLPPLTKASLIGAFALTEKLGGSDLSGISLIAKKAPDGYCLNGEKYFISNALRANFIITLALIEGAPTLVVIENKNGLRVEPIKKIGLCELDNSIVTFDEVFVPKTNILGTAGQATFQLASLLPRERLIIAVKCNAGSKRALETTESYLKSRRIGRERALNKQTLRLKLSELKIRLQASMALTAQCALEVNKGCESVERAASAKWLASELYKEVTDQCIQFLGARGFESETDVARLFLNSRGSSLQGGSSQIMLETAAFFPIKSTW